MKLLLQNRLRLIIFSIVLLCSSQIHASPALFTYQGRIVGSNGAPLEYNNVSFEFRITNPTGTCILYREQLNNVDMTNSKGVFDTPIGAGTKLFPLSASFSLLDAFANSGSLNCEGGATYVPAADDSRRLRVQFNDGVGWKVVSPDNIIRSVPYAGYAAKATTASFLGSNIATDFILKNSVNGGVNCDTGSFLTWDAATSTFGCAGVSGASGGTVTNVSSANSYITVSNPAAAPVLTLQVGTTAGTVAVGNDSRFTDARTPTGTAGGDLTGTYPNPTLQTSSVTSAKILDGTLGVADLAPGSLDGQVFRYNGSVWQHAKLNYADLVNATGTSPWPSGSCGAGQYITWVSVADGFSCTTMPAEADPKIGANTTNYLSKWDGSALVTSGVFENAGNVGIGTATPNYPLEVGGYLGSRAADPRFVSYDNSNVKTSPNMTGGIEMRDSANSLAGYMIFDTGDSNTDMYLGVNTAGGNGGLRMQTAGSDRMYIDYLGNIGIGTTSPTNGVLEITKSQDGQTRLWVSNYHSGTASRSILFVDSDVAGVELTAHSSTTAVSNFRRPSGATLATRSSATGGISIAARNAASGIITFHTGGDVEKMRIDQSGNVGIGTTSPTTKLEVVGTVKATAFEGPLTASTNSTGAGSNVAPSMTFTGDADTGFYNTSSNNTISVATGAVKIFDFTSLGLIAPTTGGASVTTANGTAGAPTYSFAGDADTGWFRAADNVLAASTGGSERIRIDSSGNVGIGTTNPTQKLDVSGGVRAFTSANGTGGTSASINEDGGLKLRRPTDASSGTVNGYIDFYGLSVTDYARISYDETNLTLIFRNTTSNLNTSFLGGKVGIGTTAPTKPLHVVGTGANQLLLERSAAGENSLVYSNSNGAWAVGQSISGTNSFDFYTGGSSWMTLLPTGHLGLGTSSPVAKLHMSQAVSNGSIGFLMENTSSTSPSANLYFKNPNRLWGVGVRGDTSDVFAIQDDTAGAIRMAVTSTGRIGMGTSSPAAPLDIHFTGDEGLNIKNTGSGHASVYIDGGTGAGGSYVRFRKAGTEAFWINSDASSNLQFRPGGGTAAVTFTNAGSVGIGTGAPGSKLDVQGGGVNASGGYTQTSDIRLKTRIEALDSETALGKILSLRGILYDWKDQKKLGEERQIGLIAQDVEKVFPEAVKKDGQGFLSVSYSNLVAPIIESIKALFKKSEEQSRHIASLQAQNEALVKKDDEKEKRIRELENRLERLEKSLGPTR